MKLASLYNPNNPDGTLVVISDDAKTYMEVPKIAKTMREAMMNWDEVKPLLEEKRKELSAVNESESRHQNYLKKIQNIKSVEGAEFTAPIPLANGWIDASLFPSHGQRMQQWKGEPDRDPAVLQQFPLHYEGHAQFQGSGKFPNFEGKTQALDYEAEYGVVTGYIKQGAAPQEVENKIIGVVQINDLTQRGRAKGDLDRAQDRQSYGFSRQAKPHSACAPFLVTLDELQEKGLWKDGKLHATVNVTLNGEDLTKGLKSNEGMAMSLPEFISNHVASHNPVVAGNIIGSGTISNPNEEVGNGAIVEANARRGIKENKLKADNKTADEITAELGPVPAWLKVGDKIEMNYTDGQGKSIFGALSNEIVNSKDMGHELASRGGGISAPVNAQRISGFARS